MVKLGGVRNLVLRSHLPLLSATEMHFDLSSPHPCVPYPCSLFMHVPHPRFSFVANFKLLLYSQEVFHSSHLK